MWMMWSVTKVTKPNDKPSPKISIDRWYITSPKWFGVWDWLSHMTSGEKSGQFRWRFSSSPKLQLSQPWGKERLGSKAVHDQGGQSPYFFGPKPGRQGQISDKVTGSPARSPPQTHTQPQADILSWNIPCWFHADPITRRENCWAEEFQRRISGTCMPSRNQAWQWGNPVVDLSIIIHHYPSMHIFTWISPLPSGNLT